MTLQPLATFDCLFVSARMQKQLGGFTSAELHLLSYLACLLWIYKGKPLTDWGYSFVGTELGAPYSRDVDETVQILTTQGFFIETEDCLHTTEFSRQMLEDLAPQILYQERSECLRASAASVLALSLGTVREAMAGEPELDRARQFPVDRHLLEEPALATLYEQFQILRAALGDRITDLRSPAIAWLTALFQTTLRKEEAK